MLFALLGLAGCQDYHEWNQKLTVVVETPSGEVNGSAVVKINAAFGQLPMSANEVNYQVHGEATVVEVAKGKYLFALLGGSQERFYAAVKDRFKDKRRGEWLYLIPEIKDVVPLLDKNQPMLVTFEDINDPASVKQVDPNDLASTFGAGYALKEITLEITDEPVTKGKVEEVLEWWSSYKNKQLDGDRYTSLNAIRRFANSLNRLSFKREN